MKNTKQQISRSFVCPSAVSKAARSYFQNKRRAESVLVVLAVRGAVIAQALCFAQLPECLNLNLVDLAWHSMDCKAT